MSNNPRQVTKQLLDNSNIEFRTGKGGWCGGPQSFLTIIDPNKYSRDICHLSISLIKYVAKIEKGMLTKPLQDAFLASGIEAGITSSHTTWYSIRVDGTVFHWYDNMGNLGSFVVYWDEWKWAWNVVNGDSPQETVNNIDMNKFPHKCSLCGNPIYRGLINIEHAIVSECKGR